MLSLVINIKLILVLLIIIFVSNVVLADIYIYIDKHGNQHFAERKVDKNYRLLLRSDTNKAPATFKNWKEKSYNNTHVPRDKRLQHLYHPMIVKAARENQLEPAFLHAVITAESSYQSNAISRAGAMGLMQLMPVTAERFGVDDPFDPQQSINAGALYLNILLEEFKTKELALAAYNAGEGTVRRNNLKIPPYPETRRYVDKVIGFYWYYKDNL